MAAEETLNSLILKLKHHSHLSLVELFVATDDWPHAS